MKKTQRSNQSEFLWERQQWCSLVCGELQGVGARETRGGGGGEREMQNANFCHH